LTPTILVGRAIALLRVSYAISDRISTDTYLAPGLSGMTVEYSHRAEPVDAMTELLQSDIAY
jgi:hypothetical protein